MFIPILISQIILVAAIIIIINLSRINRKNRFLLEADNALKTGDYQSALNLSRKVLSIDNYNSYAKFYAGEASFGLGNKKEGIRYYKTALFGIQPKDLELRDILYRKIADYHYEMKEYEDAIVNYNILLNYDPKQFSSYLKLAHIYYDQKDYVKSLSLVNTFLKNAAENIDSLFIKSSIYFELRNFDESSKGFQILVNQSDINDHIKLESYIKLIKIAMEESNGFNTVEYSEKALDIVKKNKIEGIEPELLGYLIIGYLFQRDPVRAYNIVETNKDQSYSSKYSDIALRIGSMFLQMGEEFKALKTLSIIDTPDLNHQGLYDFFSSNKDILNYPELESMYCSKPEIYLPFIMDRLSILQEFKTDDNKKRSIFFERNNKITIVYHSLEEMKSSEIGEIKQIIMKTLGVSAPQAIKIYHFHKPQLKADEINLSSKTTVISGEEFVKAFTSFILF